jgi:hypothetical protein
MDMAVIRTWPVHDGLWPLLVPLSCVEPFPWATGERIRDKITASKRKGLWMGGICPGVGGVHGRHPNVPFEVMVRWASSKLGVGCLWA